MEHDATNRQLIFVWENAAVPRERKMTRPAARSTSNERNACAPNHRYLSGLNPDTAAAAAVTPSSAHALPERPSVAVLPFTNLGGDGEQEYVADGIAEDIITELSRFGGLFVVARNSSFQWQGKPDIR